MKLFDVYSLFDISLVKAEDVFVWDAQGKQYLDLYGGHAVISIGHGHPHYKQLLKEQLNKIGFYSNSVKNELQEELAQKLGELSGYQDYNLFLCNSGAEANENALKLASFHNGRKKVISFKKAFHGRTSLGLSVTDNPNLLAPINEVHETVFVDFEDFDQVEVLLAKGDVCAVIIEGIQGVGGLDIASKAFMQQLRKLCSQFGTLLIIDEIQSGYGRTGKFFAHQYHDIKADIISVAKGMGNGFPIGGILIHPDINSKYGMLGTTFGGNHLASAAGIAVLDIIKEEKLMEHASELGAWFQQEISNLSAIKQIKGMGLMLGLEFDFPIKELRQSLLTNSNIFTGFSGTNLLRILPPLTIQKSHLSTFITQLKIQLNHEPESQLVPSS